jgi:hypothetical protein
MTQKFRSKRNNRKYGGESSNRCIWNGTKYEGQCPGVAAFKEAVQLIHDDPEAVYTILGHGCDLRNEIYAIEPERKYITRVACGLPSDYKAVDESVSIIDDFLNNKLKTPITKTTLKKYNKFKTGKINLRSGEKEILVTGNETYNIHTLGKKYVNNKNWCIMEGGMPGGLRRLGDHVGQILNLDDFNQNGRQPITLRQHLLSHYEGALFPTISQLNSAMNDESKNWMFDGKLDDLDYKFDYNLKERFKDFIKTNFSIDYGTVMDNLRGTFINTSCRNICDLAVTESPLENDYLGQDEFVEFARRTVSGERVPPHKVDQTFEEYNLSELTDKLEQEMKTKGKPIINKKKNREIDAPQVRYARYEAEKTGDTTKLDELKITHPGLFAPNPMTRGVLGGKLSKYKKNYLKRSKVQRK